MPDLELGLEAGPEPEPEAGNSTASRRGSLAEHASRCSFFRQWNRQTGGDPGGIKTREPGHLVTYFALCRSSEQLCEICSKNYTV